MYIRVFLTILPLCLRVWGSNPRLDPLVRVEQGLLRGQRSADGSYSTFYGVPYAEIDTENKFGPAKRHPGFGNNIYEAIDRSAICPQTLGYTAAPKRDEGCYQTIDCLRLNIYVPNSASVGRPLPVFAWIPGGAFNTGGACDFGVPNVLRHDVIVVVMNYRVGAYGFMCTDSPLAPGNQGLKDQHEALLWVRRNIAAFGGDPYNVTIGGNSAGGASSLYHLYSKKEKIYNNIISESGVPDTLGLFAEGVEDSAIKLANHLGLNANNTEEAIKSLSNTDHVLVSAAYGALNMRFMPCKERAFNDVESFIDDYPFNLSNRNKVRNTPILIGHTDNENFGEIFEIPYGDDYFTDPFRNRVKRSFNMSENNIDKVAAIVKNFYVGDAEIDMDIERELAEFESDAVFNHPTHRAVKVLLKENAGPIYQYMFAHGAGGTLHSSNKIYMFQPTQVIGDVDEEVTQVENYLALMWSNFIKYGNPTPQLTDLVPIIWEPVSENVRPYMHIDIELRLEHRIFHRRMTFWDVIYSLYEKFAFIAY